MMKMMNRNVSLAVLPFRKDKLRDHPVIEHFEEDLVYHLSKFHGLSILSFFSTSQWSLNDTEVLDRYYVSHVITGSFRLVGDRVILSVQLIGIPNHQVIYDQRVDFYDDEVFDLFDQSIIQITNLLQTELDRSILSNSYQKPKVGLQTYELLLMGNALLKDGTPESDLKARSFFEEALKQQPKYARAYAGISSSYFNQWSCQMWDRWEISQSGAKKYALKAIENDENDYQALFILGRVLLFERDFDQAEFYLRKSLGMNNNDPSTLLETAFSLMFLGEVNEAKKLYDRACYLNPLKEHKYLAVGATLSFESGDFHQALLLGSRLELSSTYIDFPVYMAAASHYLGFEKEANEYWEYYLQKFDKHIYFLGKDTTQEALTWQINVNPYRGGTRLEEYHEYLKGKNNTDPLMQDLTQADELALAVEEGWGSLNVKTSIAAIAEHIELSVEDTTELVERGAYEAAQMALEYGAEAASQLIPLPQTDAEINNTISAPLMQDHTLQLNILRELTTMLHEKTDLNAVLGMIIEGIYRALNMERTVVAFVSPADDILRAKYVLGDNNEKLQKQFLFSNKEANLFSHLLKSKNPFWCNAQTKKEIQSYINEELKTCLGTLDFFAMPIWIGNQGGGIIYADCKLTGRQLTAEEFQTFTHFSEYASIAFDLLIIKKG